MQWQRYEVQIKQFNELFIDVSRLGTRISSILDNN